MYKKEGRAGGGGSSKGSGSRAAANLVRRDEETGMGFRKRRQQECGDPGG